MVLVVTAMPQEMEHFPKEIPHGIVTEVIGIGKVVAARNITLAIERHKPDFVINFGSAGALSPELDFGEIVLSKDFVDLDFDLSVFGDPIGQNPAGKMTGDEKMLCLAKTEADVLGIKNIAGRIGTTDNFNNDPAEKLALHQKFAADCDEMEGAAIALCCALSKIPFLGIRAISDKPKDKDKLEFWDNLDFAAKNAAAVAAALARKLI